MKRLLLLLLMTGVLDQVQSQFVHKIKADSVLITNDSCTAELNLENSTRNIKGFLYNKGNGRTEFRKVVNLNDSVIIVGEDTITIVGTFENGLTRVGKNVKLGGTLIQPTIINESSAANHLTITGPSTSIGTGVLNVNNPGTGTAIGITSSFGIGIFTSNISSGIWSNGPGPGITAFSNSNPAGTFQSTNSRAAYFTTLNNTSNLQEVIGIIRNTVTSPATNGIGSMINFYTQTNGTTGSINRISTQLESSWENAGDSVRSALFRITLPVPGTNSRSELAKFFSPGNIQFPRYTGSTFTVNDSTTYKPVVMDASGNIRKFDSWAVSGSGGGGGATDGDKGDIIVSNSGANWNLESYVPKVLASGTVSNAAQMDVLLTSAVLGGTFDRVEIQVELRPATSGANLQLRFSTDGGSTFNAGASDYEFVANWRTSSGSGNDVGANASAATLVNACGNESSSGAKGTITIHNYFDGTQRTSYQGHLITHSSSSQAIIMSEVGGQRKAAQDTDAVRFFFSTGNITGSYRVIGYKNR